MVSEMPKRDFPPPYLLAKGIQSVMGAKSLKINWKVESLMTGASLATLLLASSKRSPIHEA